MQLVIFLPTFNAPYKRLKIDVMEREWKNLEFGGDLNKALFRLEKPVASPDPSTLRRDFTYSSSAVPTVFARLHSDDSFIPMLRDLTFLVLRLC